MHRSKFIFLYFFLLLALVSVSSIVSAQAPVYSDTNSEESREKILAFDSYIQIQANSDLIVTETITVQSYAKQIQHGITRDFPTKYPDQQGKTVQVNFRLLQTSLDDQTTPHREAKLDNGLRIYLGDPQQLLSPGVHIFRIQYRVDHELGYFQNYDELYWNVTGNGWAFPINQVKATIDLPPQATVLQYSAYTGYQHEKGQDYTVNVSSNKNRIEFTTTRLLQEREGLTIAVAWPKGFVQPPRWQDEIKRTLFDNPLLLLSSMFMVILLGYFLLVWYLFGKEPPKGVIIPLYNPPMGFSPAAVRYLAKFNLDTKALVATLISLAVKRKINIKETNNDYILTAENLDNTNLTTDEAHLLDKLFTHTKQYIIPKKPSNYEEAASARMLNETGSSALKEILHANLKNYFKLNLFYFSLGAIFAFVIVYLLAKDSGDYISIIIVLTLGLVSVFFVKSLWGKWQANSQLGFLQRSFRTTKNFLLPLIVLAAFIGTSFLVGRVIDLVLLLILLLIVIGFYFLLRVYTPQGQQLMDKIRGLKMFLNTTEKYRLPKWQPPEKTPELYERLLPYAIALDAENNWTAQFKEVLSQAELSDKAVFTWYSGPSAFNGLNFSRSISNGFTSAMLISSSMQAPGSSSGISGGGWSGGGGGGGGGRGW